jgi:transcriptional accessory protein Tex/SPT6
MGYISTDRLSDNFIEHPSEVVQADETVLGRIIDIDKVRFNVRITYVVYSSSSSSF